MVNAIRVNNQLTVNGINAAAENFRTLNRTIESVKHYTEKRLDEIKLVF